MTDSPEDGRSGVAPVHPLLRRPPVPVSGTDVVARTPPQHASSRITELNPQREQAAILTAWGWTAVRVGQEVGVRAETVHRWRQAPVFIERMVKELELIVQGKRVRVERDQQAAFDARESARARLVELLDATDLHGNALIDVQTDAAKILMDDKAATSEFAEKRESTVDVNVQLGSVWHVYPDRIESGEVVDAEITPIEEEDDADR